MNKKAIPVDINNLPEILKELLAEQKRKGHTQRAICAKAGVSETAVKSWKDGQRFPQAEMLCYLLDAMGKKLVIVDKEAMEPWIKKQYR